jgi:hypothetical protein
MASAELQVLARQLAEAAETFDLSTGQEALKSRIEIISKAKQIATLMLAPEEIPMQHSSNVSANIGFPAAVLNFMQMAELVAIRSLMKMRVLENIPLESSISLQELSKKTGAQDSLLGSFPPSSSLKGMCIS